MSLWIKILPIQVLVNVNGFINVRYVDSWFIENVVILGRQSEVTSKTIFIRIWTEVSVWRKRCPALPNVDINFFYKLYLSARIEKLPKEPVLAAPHGSRLEFLYFDIDTLGKQLLHNSNLLQPPLVQKLVNFAPP